MPKRTDTSKVFALLLTLWSSVAALACTTVLVSGEFETRNIRYAITWHGKLVEGARIDVSEVSTDGKPSRSQAAAHPTLVTKSDGQAFLQNLQPGTYDLTVTLPDKPAIKSRIDISPKAGPGTTEMPYEVDNAWINGDESFLKQLPTQTWVKSFRGIVEDESGAVIPDAKVKIQLVTSNTVTEIANLTTGKHGEFALPLPQGKYVAIMRVPGFRVSGIPIEVSQNGWDGFKATLRVADCDHVVDSEVKLEALNQ